LHTHKTAMVGNVLTPWGVIASFDRVYTSSSAPQCERKGPPGGPFLRSNLILGVFLNRPVPQSRAASQENIKSMTATIKQLEERNMFVERRIKQLEERNMFLERRHENCTGKLEELLREQRKTEENDA